MAIGIVSDDDFFEEMNRLGGRRSEEVRTPTPVIEGEVEPIPTRGRKEGDVNVPDSLRQIIASTAMMDGRQAALDLARDFGISPSSVSAYTKGATSTASYHNPTPSIIGHIQKTRERAIKRASKTLNAALGAITQEKLDYTDADKLSGIAKDMSVIIKNLEPQTTPQLQDSGNKGVQFTIFAPQFRDERTFETLKITE